MRENNPMRVSTLRWWVVAFVTFLIGVYLLKGMLLPFIAGLALAYFLDPVADRLQRMGLGRTPAVLLITSVFMLSGLGVILLIIPVIQAQLLSLVHNAPRYADSGWTVLSPYVDWLRTNLPAKQVEAIEQYASNYASFGVQWIAGVATRMLSQGAAIFSLLSLLIITPVVTIYLLRDWDHIVAKVDGWLPHASAKTIREIAHDVDLTLAGFIRGQATVCLVLACVYGVGLSLVGLEAGLIVGMATGLAAFIPYVGGITGFLVAMLLALFQFNEWGPIVSVIGVFVVGQGLEGYVLTPRLVGGRIGLHPVWVLFALLAGASLLGFAGVLIALPVAAVIGVMVRHGLRRYLASSVYSGESEVHTDD